MLGYHVDADDRAYDAWVTSLASAVSQGYYTIARPDGHHTFKVGTWRADTYRPNQKIRWIGLLVGSDNESDYRTCASQSDDGTVRLIRAFAGRDGLASELAVLFGDDVEGRSAMREAYALASGRCARCNLMLTVPASIHRGLGPDCAQKVGM